MNTNLSQLAVRFRPVILFFSLLLLLGCSDVDPGGRFTMRLDEKVSLPLPLDPEDGGHWRLAPGQEVLVVEVLPDDLRPGAMRQVMEFVGREPGIQNLIIEYNPKRPDEPYQPRRLHFVVEGIE